LRQLGYRHTEQLAQWHDLHVMQVVRAIARAGPTPNSARILGHDVSELLGGEGGRPGLSKTASSYRRRCSTYPSRLVFF
jgi:hypothetical protein